MRLIDADALFEKVPYGDIEHDVKISKCGAIADICTWILTAPTIDAVPVVRCKDCKWFIPAENLTDEYDKPIGADGLCEDIDKYADCDGFCSYGERRSDA